MSIKEWFKRSSFVWRIKVYIEELESRVDEIPLEYKKVKQEFEEDLKGYSTVIGIYYVSMLVFYASIVTSVTAALGFEINVFQQVYSILGFSTVGVVYLVSAYLKRLAWVDLDNSRIRLVSYLTQREFENRLH